MRDYTCSHMIYLHGLPYYIHNFHFSSLSSVFFPSFFLYIFFFLNSHSPFYSKRRCSVHGPETVRISKRNIWGQIRNASLNTLPFSFSPHLPLSSYLLVPTVSLLLFFFFLSHSLRHPLFLSLPVAPTHCLVFPPSSLSFSFYLA